MLTPQGFSKPSTSSFTPSPPQVSDTSFEGGASSSGASQEWVHRPQSPVLSPIYEKKDYRGYGSAEVQVYYPTMEEFANFSGYVAKIENEFGPHLSCGICKVRFCIIFGN